MLTQLGVSNADAQVYVYLSKKGPLTEKDLSKALKLNKRQLHWSLKNLKSKDMVNCITEHRFTAIALEVILDQHIKTNKEQASALQASKKDFLSNWGI